MYLVYISKYVRNDFFLEERVYVLLPPIFQNMQEYTFVA